MCQMVRIRVRSGGKKAILSAGPFKEAAMAILLSLVELTCANWTGNTQCFGGEVWVRKQFIKFEICGLSMHFVSKQYKKGQVAMAPLYTYMNIIGCY